MKILLAASEVAPLIKLGGLGDVVGSLPKALEKIDVNVDVIVPFYPIAKTGSLRLYKSTDLEVPFANAIHVVEVFKTKLPDSQVDVLLLRNAEFFSLGGKDAFLNTTSETEMFSFFCRAVVEYIKVNFNTYDLVHCNDWHTGMITHLLEDELGDTRPATLLTIHNLAYQGIGDAALVQELGIDSGEHPLINWDIQDGDINLMLQGITSSDYISTVSPSYAKEILLKDMGAGFHEILQNRQNRLVGILNGIDYSQFPRDFDLKNYKNRKLVHKNALLQKLGIKDFSAPLFSLISRLDSNQKGLDILWDVIPEIIKAGGKFILLGTGDKAWEKKFKDLTLNEMYKDAMSINIMFDVSLAREIYAGSDFFLMPSKYEPCGLAQMIAMWYGTLPIVHATGGLRDTVKEGINGFSFDIYSTSDLLKAIRRARKIYKSQKFYELLENCLKEDFSWDKSAQNYKNLYEMIVKVRIEQEKTLHG